MDLGVVSVAQTALSAVSQVGNLRAWLYPDASLVFTPADCQSAIRQTTSRLPVCATTLAASFHRKQGILPPYPSVAAYCRACAESSATTALYCSSFAKFFISSGSACGSNNMAPLPPSLPYSA